ncbi:MAG: tRNA 2-thiouridine(34) synthase MnmA [Chitinispirillia bacterium]|nr:tRNA 2-thiouridine(34) synthase MnmA [Chitinispirillia bacterium]
MKKVLAAMSGGVDSSVAAALLKEQGFEVSGVTMRLFGDRENSAVSDAKIVADALSIPHHTVDAVDLFEREVISYFLSEYRSGRTPNPCVKCNHRLKFGLLMEKAVSLGCDFLATGHYAIIEDGDLRRGVDPQKDQSYFLYPIFASEINKILFPLGGLTKDNVREIAKKLDLPVASKKESQDICFIPSGDYLQFLKSRGIGVDHHVTAGNIVDINGKILGKHTGVCNFTVGQRKGLGALGKRMYVKQIIVDTNTVVAADEDQLETSIITVKNLLCSTKAELKSGDRFHVQIRYRSKPSPASIINCDSETLTLQFDEPVKAAAPGQSAVLYDGDVAAAGGVIFPHL